MLTKSKRLKIGIITSRGGHLFQMYQLKKWWVRYDRFWVTIPGDDVFFCLKSEKTYYGHGPESRNVINAVRNTILAIRILIKEKPSIMVSCGAGIAPPFFYIGKLFGVKLIFIEPYDFIKYPSLSGKLVEPIVDILLVQQETQLHFFGRAIYKGSTL